MNTTELKKHISYLYPLNMLFNGIYSIDNVDTAPFVYPLYIICNTAPSYSRGENWIAIYIKNKCYGEFFDSYGRAPNKDFKRFLFTRCRKIVNNKKQVQGLFTNVCGGHCMYFLFHRSRGSSMNEIVKQMNDKDIVSWMIMTSPVNRRQYSDFINSPPQKNQTTKMMYKNVNVNQEDFE